MATLKINGDKMPPCGVPVQVSSRSPRSVRTPALRNALTSASTRLSLTLARTRSRTAQCERVAKDSPPYYGLPWSGQGAPGLAGAGGFPAGPGGGAVGAVRGPPGRPSGLGGGGGRGSGGAALLGRG